VALPALGLDGAHPRRGGERLDGPEGRAGQARAEDEEPVTGAEEDPGGDRGDPDDRLEHEAAPQPRRVERRAAGAGAGERAVREPAPRLRQRDPAPQGRPAPEDDQDARDEQQPPRRPVGVEQQARERDDGQGQAEDDGAPALQAQVAGVGHVRPTAQESARSTAS
jgi:hypothetical protein